MRIRICSDIHSEFSDGNFDLPVHDGEDSTVLIIAGDLGVAKSAWSYTKILKEMCGRFQDVIYIPGNHEYYKTSLLRAVTQIRRNIERDLGGFPENLHFDDFHVLIRDDVAFICATLWTDMDRGSPITIQRASNEMNDYKVIRTGPSTANAYMRTMQPVHTMEVHARHKKLIMEMLEQHKDKKCIVVSHHAPSYQSVAPRYVSANSGAYVSEFYSAYGNEDIMPVLHIHGHVHDSFDYMLGDTRVICNPRGYVGMEVNPNFDPNLVVEV